MKELYLIQDSYVPNTAPLNRFLAFVKGYGELGISTKVVFMFPSKSKDKVEGHYENVEFIYLWEKYCPSNKYLRHLWLRLMLFKFILDLKKDKIVILYGMTKFLYLFSLNKNIRLYHERTECPALNRKNWNVVDRLQYIIYKKACKKIDGLFVISPSLKTFFVENFDISKEKLHIINMIVDSSRFNNISFTKKKNTIAYCGKISERKDGISDLIKAFKKVSEYYSDVTLTLVGAFENNTTKANVHKLIKILSIEDKVVITGVIEADRMPLLLSEAKILVLSRPQNKQAQYGFPTKLGEYLMTANPIVITDVGDFKAYLKDKEELIYALPDNSDDFADKLIWVLNNYEKAKKIGIKGREVAIKSFNYKVEAQKVLDVIF